SLGRQGRLLSQDRAQHRTGGRCRALSALLLPSPEPFRNCFELLVESLRIIKRRLGDSVTIVTAGEQWDPAQFGVDGLLHNLGVLDYRATGALYRACDAGAVMMTTAHTSYLPLELMA